ncbi:hypothetical protein HanXRQr2_Chr12g0559411 [Helianthus annuus]|uniref:Uncharacterized protein n=1 Tax=Helianthus annuus TaxID=4232 RepID=A0A9K3MXN6_HELAN|nr:hypothetical protein HanXRQr2_Chr12g0559411 [Helianthus annuus]
MIHLPIKSYLLLKIYLHRQTIFIIYTSSSYESYLLFFPRVPTFYPSFKLPSFNLSTFAKV